MVLDFSGTDQQCFHNKHLRLQNIFHIAKKLLKSALHQWRLLKVREERKEGENKKFSQSKAHVFEDLRFQQVLFYLIGSRVKKVSGRPELPNHTSN